MRRTAQALRDQARELRAIATTDGRLEGAYADTLRAGAADLDHHLRQTAERYEHVHAHLTNWANELDDMQSESTVLLRRAQEESSGPAGAPVGTHPDDDPVQPLRRSLNRLTADRDDRAAVYAARIRHACDDVIADSAWEGVEDAVGAVLDADWVGKVFEAAGWIVTIVGIAALFLTPAGWIVDLVLGLTIALITKDVIALLVGDGSWFDIGMDVVGLLAVGAGKIAFRALTEIQAATKLAAERALEERATAAALHDIRPALDRTYSITRRRGTSQAAKTAARQLRARLRAAAERAGANARQSESARPLAEASRPQTIAYGGDQETANLAADIDHLHTNYGQHEAVRQALHRVALWKGAYKASWMVGMGTDATDKIIGRSSLAPRKPYSRPYDDFKNRLQVGTSW
ncbi:hypothetical protein [Streptantibioticus silvisoli]|uniref:WXG100 family type VII secretion target n=1 Tax=Streptantibioticus silvisoli TaxID=2705255 RepID=A0ABT6W2V1_9ACTN|nr:hypothetical protein [Streptantibioticus silvisoli]MDI5965070.1 hypothetical protein [Streptantibioticus silvisoli]